MLAVTNNAAEAIKALASAPGAEGVRISPGEAEDGVALELQLELSEAPQSEDMVLEVDEGEVRFAVVEQGNITQSRNGHGPDA
jgi:Fe-S cluster assembly iron-binding protein IscA